MIKLEFYIAFFCIFCVTNVSSSEREPLVFQFFKVLHSLTPKGFNQEENYGDLIDLKDRYLDTYKYRQPRYDLILFTKIVLFILLFKRIIQS